MSGQTLAITETQAPAGSSRHAGYHGRLPTWSCPFCGRTNRRTSLEVPRPADVPDECPCGAAAADDYSEATKEEVAA